MIIICVSLCIEYIFLQWLSSCCTLPCWISSIELLSGWILWYTWLEIFWREANLFIFYFIVFINLFILFYLFLAALGLCCCTRAFSSCGERGLLFVVVRGFSLRWLLLLWSTGSRHTGFSSCGSWALERRLSSCGARA